MTNSSKLYEGITLLSPGQVVKYKPRWDLMLMEL